jgi:hypothetical protein
MSFKDWSAAQTKSGEKTAAENPKSPASKATEATRPDGTPTDSKPPQKS